MNHNELLNRLRKKAQSNPVGALQYALEYDRLHGTNLAKQLLSPDRNAKEKPQPAESLQPPKRKRGKK